MVAYTSVTMLMSARAPRISTSTVPRRVGCTPAGMPASERNSATGLRRESLARTVGLLFFWAVMANSCALSAPLVCGGHVKDELEGLLDARIGGVGEAQRDADHLGPGPVDGGIGGLVGAVEDTVA